MTGKRRCKRPGKSGEDPGSGSFVLRRQPELTWRGSPRHDVRCGPGAGAARMQSKQAPLSWREEGGARTCCKGECEKFEFCGPVQTALRAGQGAGRIHSDPRVSMRSDALEQRSWCTSTIHTAEPLTTARGVLTQRPSTAAAAEYQQKARMIQLRREPGGARKREHRAGMPCGVRERPVRSAREAAIPCQPPKSLEEARETGLRTGARR